MLSAENTDLLCRVGRGTPMGDLMRQYWLPVGYSWEYEAEGQPQRVRVLGEDLVIWRTLDGTPAFTQANCPHRGAGFFYGRTEEEGLRCAYHGWKFDADGQCVDMPNEPAESAFKQKVRITAYKGADYGGVTWIYMGPNQDDPPGIPLFEWGQIPPENVSYAQKIVYECNWMQALEGELDSTHVYFLHRRLNVDDSPRTASTTTTSARTSTSRRSPTASPTARSAMSWTATSTGALRSSSSPSTGCSRRRTASCRSPSTCRWTTTTPSTWASGGNPRERCRATASRTRRCRRSQARSCRASGR